MTPPSSILLLVVCGDPPPSSVTCSSGVTTMAPQPPGARIALGGAVGEHDDGGVARKEHDQPSQPAASCFACAVIALRMNIATVTGPTPPGTGVTQLATSFTASVSTSPTI